MSNVRKAGPPLSEINGVSLLVFFDDGNPANNRDVVIFNGNDSNKINTFDSNGWSAAWGAASLCEDPRARREDVKRVYSF